MTHRDHIAHFVLAMSCTALSLAGCALGTGDVPGNEATPAEGSENSQLGLMPHTDFCSGVHVYTYGGLGSLPSCQTNTSFNNSTCRMIAQQLCNSQGGLRSFGWTCFTSGSNVDVDCSFSCNELCGGT